MNKSERKAIGITLSLFAHFIILQDFTFVHNLDFSSNLSPIVLELNQNTPSLSSEDEGLALQHSPNNEENAAINQKRLIRQQFLEEVSNAIHQRRLNLGNHNLIGIAWYSFTIEEDGSFSSIKLEKSSGNFELDKDAFYAISHASHVVKRPKILGEENFNIMLPIKYQYALQ